MKRIGFRIRLGLASVEENDQEKKEDQDDQDGLGFGSKSDSEWESNQIRSQDLDKRQVSSTPGFHPLLPHSRELREPGYNNVCNACASVGLLLLLLLLHLQRLLGEQLLANYVADGENEKRLESLSLVQN